MFNPGGTNVTVGLWIGVSILLLIILQYTALRGRALSKKVYPSVCSAIGAMIFIRLLVPFKFVYTHELTCRGALASIFRSIDKEWGTSDKPTYVSLFSMMILIWVTGAIINLVMDIHYYKQSVKFVRVNSEDITDNVLNAGYLTKEQLNRIRRRRIRFLKMKYISSPQTCGLFRQVILLPDVESDIFSDEQWRFIIAHEMAHIKRFDVQKKFLLFVLKNIYWFIPLIRVYTSSADDLAEIYVDEKSAAGQKEQYMESILSIMKKVSSDPKRDKMFMLNPVALFSDKKQMTLRFKKMMEYRQQSKMVSAIVFLLSMVIFVSSYLFTFYPEPNYEYYAEREAEEGLMLPTRENSQIIRHDDGTYTVMVYGVAVDETDSLELYGRDIPMYDEEGNRIEWPFFHN